MKTIATIALAVALGLAWVGAAIPAETVKEKATDAKDTVKDKAVDTKDKIKEKATEAKDKIKDAFKRDNNTAKDRDKTRARVTRGPDVRSAQEALRDKGFDPGPADGVMGPRTRAAVMEFQKKEGLEPNGRLDATTMARLGVETRSSAADPAQPSASPSTGGDSSTTPKTAPQPSKKQAQ